MSGQWKEAFLEQLNPHLAIAHKVARLYCFDTEDQEDLLQEMMYQLWRSFPGFDRRSKFSTWMYRVCLNTGLTYRRKNKRTPHESLSPLHQQLGEPDTGPREDATAMLYEAIATVSPLNKAIILLYLEDLSYEEITAVTGLTRTNVSVRLVRIKKELELKLNPKTKPADHVKS